MKIWKKPIINLMGLMIIKELVVVNKNKHTAFSNKVTTKVGLIYSPFENNPVAKAEPKVSPTYTSEPRIPYSKSLTLSFCSI
jgi:hypothetical protein